MDVSNDGQSGWEMATAYSYDVIILDLMLSGLSGTEVLKRIRRNKSPVPVLVLTAKDGTSAKVENFEAGADDYLTKPFAFAELLVRVKSLLRRGASNRPSLASANEAFDLAQARYQVGSSSIVELSQAQLRQRRRKSVRRGQSLNTKSGKRF